MYHLQHSTVNLLNMCDRLGSRLAQKSTTHHVHLDFEGAPEIVITDPQLLEMILSNLLANAFHFSPSGAVVKVRWGRNEDGLSLCIEDQGPGIAEDEQVRIF